MKSLLKPKAILPIVIGLVVGAALFIIGNAEDAPGMCVIGLSVAFVLSMWGIYNAGIIKKGFLAPIYLLCFGAGGIVLSVVLLIDGEFGESPGMAAIGIVLGVVLVVAGAIRLKTARG